MTGKFIKNLTKEAGERLLKGFRKEWRKVEGRATSKEAASEYDKKIDRFIVKEIEKKYPDHNLLTEESGYVENDPKSDWLWIVDSLDGTGNFSNSNPLFSVCIAVMEKSEIKFGAVYAPAIDEFYWAKRGKGAFLNGRRIKVSGVGRMDRSYGIYCEGSLGSNKKVSRLIGKIHFRVKDLRKIGSAGIETAWIAAGRGDFYFTTLIDPWDVAAGVILVEEAGGKVTDFLGRPWKPERSNLVFSNKKLHKKALNVVKV